MPADLLIAGGGPVGLAAAIEARLAGLTVKIVEPRVGSIDKACGEGLMPGAVPLLERLGVSPQGFPLRGVSYRSASARADHRFSDGHGLGVRRTTLHATLRERALDLGATLTEGSVETIEPGRWTLGCDGLHSTVARLAGLARPGPASRRRFGLRQHYAIEPWSDLIEVHWNPLAELYVTPTADGVVGIAALTRRGTGFDEALAASPELAARVAGLAPATSLRGAGPFRQRTRARTAGRVLLVGDASGYVDAITGEGLRLGFAQARAAVAAVVAGDAAGYERDWTRITRDFRVLTGGLALAASSPLRSAIVPAAARLPRVFGAAVEHLAR